MKTITSWNEVTIGQYQDIMLIQSENPITRFIESVSIVLDCDPQELRDLPFSEYQELQKKMEFLQHEPVREVENIIEIDGKRYGLEPDMSLITAGVFIDAEQFKQDPVVNLHNTLALIYRPIIKEDGDEYEIEPHQAKGFEKRANLFKSRLSIEVVLGTVLFFSLLGMELSINTLQSFIETTYQEAETQMTMTQTQALTKKSKRKPSTKTTDSTTQS